ncbi:FAD-binding monooxygenase [Mucilaginibacter achroorhodeus]|uniref:FAD-binding monooxygenase n=1 Tax=Mucilaginibacter achroorhodeus TaxID=2599294 RepID=A0A563U9U6_9SPHI|nr:FAD-dependent monooxygenase [Mucilaginibacter achroorhodeus]TWR28157.1 FAD-binding monooxygenase [Mucilaginibacter achroorhodeus]
MDKKRVLVSGASIAGLTLSYWLQRYGFDVTIIEKGGDLRLGGQNIDVKGPAVEVVRMMGLEEKIKAANTTEVGIRFVTTKNKVVSEFSKDDAFSMTQELEILRGDLVEILYNKAKANADIRFDDHITAVNNLDNHVEVEFKSGAKENFDLLIIAEGIGSATRQKVFGNEVSFAYLGVYTSYFTAPKAATDSEWARWCNAPGGIVFLIRPDNYGTTRASVNFRSPERGYEKLPLDEQRKLLTDKIKNVGWEAPRLTEAINKSEDLYLERLSQVKAKQWYKGRVAMIGDAAYCVTPIGGKGTDLAIAGAYIVATELARNTDHTKAFEAYENRLRPYVAKVQKLPPGVPNLVYPRSKMGVAILNAAFRVAGSNFFKAVMKLFGKDKKKPKEELELPKI